MYRIIRNNIVVCIVDKLDFWKRQNNGMCVNCQEREANGIYVGDTLYHLPWMPPSGGNELDVTYEEFSGIELIAELDEEVINLNHQIIMLEGAV